MGTTKFNRRQALTAAATSGGAVLWSRRLAAVDVLKFVVVENCPAESCFAVVLVA